MYAINGDADDNRDIDKPGIRLLTKIALAEDGISYTTLRLKAAELFRNKDLLDWHLEEFENHGWIEKYKLDGEKFYRATEHGKEWAIIDYIPSGQDDDDFLSEEERAKQAKQAKQERIQN